MNTTEALISLRGITKVFPGGVKANDNISIDVLPGEIHAILGENGAGKSTLMNILFGLVNPDSGTILVRGKPVKIGSPSQAIANGIGMVHQHFKLIPNHTVAENVVLGLRGNFLFPARKTEIRIREFSERYGLMVNPKARVNQLSVGEMQRVEIIKVLFRGANVLILDEPTSVLTPDEIGSLFAVLRKMRAEGKSIIFITHKLDEVLEVADHITILRKGKVTASMPASRVKDLGEGAKKELARSMIGREVMLVVDKKPVEPGETVLEVSDLSVLNEVGREVVRGVTFSVRLKEIFGIAGVAGNGQEPLVKAVAGMVPAAGGAITVNGRISYIPEDRFGLGSIPELTVARNAVLTNYRSFSTRLFLLLPRIAEWARNIVRNFGVATPHVNVPAKQLSGGNLQRLIVGRELSRHSEPHLLIAEQPTHGLDIGSTEDVRRFLVDQRDNKAILLVSGDLEEILSLSDRVGVMYRGAMTIVEGPFTPDNVEEIGLLMTGLRKAGNGT